MLKNISISVTGGDTRSIYLARYLLSKGYRVKVYGLSLNEKAEGLPAASSFEEAMQSDAVILPLPYSKNGKTLSASFSENEITVKKFLEELKEDQHVFYGMGTPGFMREITGKGAVPHDYFEHEPLKLKNALLTAEGITSIILEKTNSTLYGLKVAVTGYGRIGHYLSALLKNAGAKVWVFARDETALTKAALSGLNAEKLADLGKLAGSFDCMVNTVPAKIFTDEITSAITPGTLLIEAASRPYGFDFDLCTAKGLSVIKAFSLPGKTAPAAAGVIIGQTVEDILGGGETP